MNRKINSLSLPNLFNFSTCLYLLSFSTCLYILSFSTCLYILSSSTCLFLFVYLLCDIPPFCFSFCLYLFLYFLCDIPPFYFCSVCIFCIFLVWTTFLFLVLNAINNLMTFCASASATTSGTWWRSKIGPQIVRIFCNFL